MVRRGPNGMDYEGLSAVHLRDSESTSTIASGLDQQPPSPNVVTFVNSTLIVTLAERYRLPAIYPFAYYAKKVGSSPTDLTLPISFGKAPSMPIKFSEGRSRSICPCNAPSKFEIVINLKAASGGSGHTDFMSTQPSSIAPELCGQWSAGHLEVLSKPWTLVSFAPSAGRACDGDGRRRGHARDRDHGAGAGAARRAASAGPR
jgi:hypothetical protein